MATNNGNRKSGANTKRQAFTAEFRGLATGKNDAGRTVTTEWGACVKETDGKPNAGDILLITPQRSERLSFTVATVTDGAPVADKVRKDAYTVEVNGKEQDRVRTWHTFRINIPTDRAEAIRLLAEATALLAD